MSDLMRHIETLGAWALERIAGLGYGFRFFVRLLWASVLCLRRPRLIVEQIHFIGNYSLLIMIVSGLFIGFVLGLQGYNLMNRYGATQSVGLMVALTLTRELGPVVTGLLFAGRAGTSLTAGIGLMKAGEQLAAMELMAVDPMQRVIAPRFVATMIAMPLLAAIFSTVGILGGWFVAVPILDVDEGVFWSQMSGGMSFTYDIMNGFIKSVVFGVICGFVALFIGHEAKPTPDGVSSATTVTVVTSSIAILASDFVLTAMMFGGFR